MSGKMKSRTSGGAEQTDWSYRLANLVGASNDEEELLRELLRFFIEAAGVESGGLLLRVGNRYDLVAEAGWSDRNPQPLVEWLGAINATERNWAEYSKDDLPEWSAGGGSRLVGVLHIGVDGELCAAMAFTSVEAVPSTEGEEPDLPSLARHVSGVLRRSCAALSERRERMRFQRVLGGADLGLWDWNIATGEVIFNRRWWRMLGYEPDAFSSDITSWEKRVHPDDLRRVKKAWAAHLGGRTPRYEAEYRLESRSGEWVWVLDNGQIVARDAQDDPIRATGIHRDVSAFKEKEIELRKINSALTSERSMFLAGDVVVFKWVNAEGWPVEYVSPNVEQILGYTVEEWLSNQVKYASIIHPDDLERVGAEVSRASEDEEENFTHEDYRVTHADGSTLWLYDHTTMLRDEQGSITHFLGYVLDVTGRRAVEENRITLEGKIQHAQKLESLGVLTGGIAHDFNNLLVGILGNADLARQDLTVESPALESVHYIEVAARRAAELVRQMLAYSGKARFVIENLDLSAIVEEMTHLLETAISKKAVLRYDFSGNIPPVEGDATQLRQIVMNLITNASDAIGDQSGMISIRTGAMSCDRAYLDDTYLHDDLPEGTYSYIEVTDSGCGMDEATTRKIFDPFFSTKFTGRGLGLAAVLGIVRSHRGALNVYSVPDQGTTFKALFPSVDDADTGDLGASETLVEDLVGVSVLLVDDEETVRAVAERMLKRMGAEVTLAEDGREAVELFRAAPERFAVVVVDLTMPHLDGDECFRELRRIDKNVPVILSSGYSEQELVERFASKGFAAFIQKPYGYDALLKKLAGVLR
jgi:PAS domain S-box-containing protein